MTASLSPGPGRSIGPVPAPDGGALGLALARALRGPPGRIVLRVEEPAPHRRRVARALLQEGALAAGGQVLDGPGGDLLLVGAEAGRAARLRHLVERLVGPAATLVWSLDRDGAALLDYAAGRATTAPAPMPAGPGLAGLDAFLDALPLPRAVRRTQGETPHGTGPRRTVFLRLEPARSEIAAELGPLGRDADLLEHAVRRIGARLFAALADPAEARLLIGPGRPARLHLPLPAGIPLGAPAAPGRPPGRPLGRIVATLPLAAVADPAAFAARQAGLARAGIALELEGLDAGALDLLDPAALPPALLRLHWSPALAAPGPMAALRALDPARLALTAGDEAAQRFAAALGLAAIEAPAG